MVQQGSASILINHIKTWDSSQLSWPLDYLPKLFRLLSIITIIPILVLFIIDVGGYLLFKLFFKPFGNYPMYSYFKQAPREYSPKGRMIDQKIDSESDGCGVEVDEVKENRPEEKVRKVLKLVDSRSKDDRSELRQRRNIDQPKPDSQRIGDDKSSDDDDKIAIHKIGFEGPMIDFKSPTASDYGEDPSASGSDY
ncbi:hypothetical protein BY996DRAFT_6412720 [Phakopsora pachyrhizi]|nr:hypothetical protein BY996DRAFT_6412720 [Phakopsora pachyrhizi]